MWFFIIFLIVPLAYLYVGSRLINPAGLSRAKKLGAWLVVVVMFALPFAARFMRRYEITDQWAEIFLNAGYISLGFFGLLFAGVLARDILLLGGRFWTWFRSFGAEKADGPAEPVGLADPTRRSFLVQASNMGLLVASGGLTGYGIYEANTAPDVARINVPIVNLPEELQGLCIVQITDLHVGPSIKRKYVESVVETANNLNPDILVITGDLVEGPAGWLKHDVSPLAELKAADGKFFVTGNHEYYHGVHAWLDEVDRLGLHTLMNQNTIIKRGSAKLMMAGVPDPRANRFDPSQSPNLSKAVQDAPESHVRVLLAHRPQVIFESSKLNFDLQLSGHTHGGQIIPFNFMVLLREPYISGLHLHDKTWIYVSRGTGYWGPPMRVGAPAEVTEIKLVKAA